MHAGWYPWGYEPWTPYVPSGYEDVGGNDLPHIRYAPRITHYVPFGEPGGNDLPGVRHAVGFLVAAATSKGAAATMTNKEAAQQIITAADDTIAKFIDSDDICPPWPHPGPPPWLSIIASELIFVANTLQEGNLRTGILQIAGQVPDRAQMLSGK